MKLIKPSEISGRILTLLDESDERVILVSPYMKIAKWYRLRNSLAGLKARTIPIEIYVRDDPENNATYKDLDELGLSFTRIPHLHSKLYMNEKYGIVSSMNLLLSSELNSLEIGYLTESWEEYVELKAYYLRYIRPGDKIQFNAEANEDAQDSSGLIRIIKERLINAPENFWFWFDGSTLHISTGRNNYDVLIHGCFLRIYARLIVNRGMQKESFKELSLKTGLIKNKARMKIEVQPGTSPGIIDVSGQSSVPLSSVHFEGILDEDLVLVTDTIVRFILAVEELKPDEDF